MNEFFRLFRDYVNKVEDRERGLCGDAECHECLYAVCRFLGKTGGSKAIGFYGPRVVRVAHEIARERVQI